MNFTIEGTLYAKFDEERVSERFSKREFVLEIEDGNYPQYPKFQLTQDRCVLLDPYQKGDKIRLQFDIKGRPYTRQDGTTAYFTNLNVWRIEPVAAADDAGNPSGGGRDEFGAPPLTASDMPPESSGDINRDDLPF